VRVVIVGAVHIAQPLSQMAALAGLEVILIDPRKAFATSERFPGVTLHASWPGPVLETLTLDARSAVITLTHDPKLDDPALVAALNSPAFYIGALGSGKTHAARLRRLQARGFDEAALARVHGPVGLPLGARSPAEIAVSILAQLVAELRREPS
jgi:xanthine dehydrogenase accessory factor